VRERDFLNWIIAAAEATNWKVWHVPAPMVASQKGKGMFVGSPRAAGLPDLFLLHDDPPRLIIAEVKGTGGKLSDRQREFLRMARAVTDVMQHGVAVGHVVGVYAWLPEHQNTIESILKSKVLI
jgi:hypothetical protein